MLANTVVLTPTEELRDLYAFLKVKNLKDAKESITGLRERVIYTRDFESLKLQLAGEN